MELHQQRIVNHAAIDFQFTDGNPGVSIHRIQHFPGLKSGRLQCRPSNVSLGDEPRQADDDSASVGAPIRGEKPTESGHHIATAVVRDAGGERLYLLGAGDHAQVVAKPLDQ